MQRHNDCSLKIQMRTAHQKNKEGESEMSNQVYQYVTDRIIEELEKGCVPWNKPWKASSDGVRVPTSYVSKKSYRGINTFLLTVARIKAGYDSNHWLTFKQIEALGGNVKGERSEMIVFWKLLEKPAKNPTPKNDTDYIPMLRYYRVFNLDQVTGIEKPKLEVMAEFEPIKEAEAIAARYQEQVEVTHGGSRAFYRPSTDSIRMPERNTFEVPAEYYSTLFHEFTHNADTGIMPCRTLDTHESRGNPTRLLGIITAPPGKRAMNHPAGIALALTREP
jgi:antirestriction protein ArdC